MRLFFAYGSDLSGCGDGAGFEGDNIGWSPGGKF